MKPVSLTAYQRRCTDTKDPRYHEERQELPLFGSHRQQCREKKECHRIHDNREHPLVASRQMEYRCRYAVWNTFSLVYHRPRVESDDTCGYDNEVCHGLQKFFVNTPVKAILCLPSIRKHGVDVRHGLRVEVLQFLNGCESMVDWNFSRTELERHGKVATL